MLDNYFICSDLHIERFYPKVPNVFDIINKNEIKENIIFAGDVGRVEMFKQYCLFMIKCSKIFKQVILVPGNHEYYSVLKLNMKEIDDMLSFMEKIIPNLTVLRDNLFVSNESKYVFYGTTLFSQVPVNVNIGLPIYINNKPISNFQFNKLFIDKCIKLEKFIDKCKRCKFELIVISHYSPTFKNTINEKYLVVENDRKYLYCSFLDNLLVKEKVYMWIFGHTGRNSVFLSKGGTLVYSNQIKHD